MRINILSVDEMGITRIELASMLKNLNVNIINVKDEIEAANALHEGKDNISAVVWTMNSIDLKEFEHIKRIKGREAYKNIPIVIISKFTDKKYIIKAIEAGAVEYIAKPYDEVTVLKKVCKILGIPFEKAMDKRVEEDFVTFNFTEMLNREVKAASRGGFPLSIMLVSIYSKDEETTTQADANEIIALINRVIKTKLRETDTSFQYGTNNLIVLLPFADKKGTEVVEKKIHSTFNTHSLIKQKNKGYSLVTASVSLPEDGKIKEKLLEKLEKNFNDRMKLEITAP